MMNRSELSSVRSVESVVCWSPPIYPPLPHSYQRLIKSDLGEIGVKNAFQNPYLILEVGLAGSPLFRGPGEAWEDGAGKRRVFCVRVCVIT